MWLLLVQHQNIFQSTLPRGERRKLYQIKCQLKYISIHAPTRGATGKRSYKKEFQHISIHAPTRGATKYSKTTKITFEISIHAPTRGATVKIILWVSTSTFQSTLPRGERRSCCNKVTVILDFNPRSHEGSDVMWLLLAQRQNVFQSTLPRGERLCSIDNAYIYIHFNPRSHEGSDV